ncbi:MAG: hypothetical protein AUH85_13165 [Chloroflexi bacterium 13_1_40CM_4_68_4]|nr:MAG: hypothetical protein AUH85_13165 [Chloroflexi bacterium 13_1_40CM_4_68_4]
MLGGSILIAVGVTYLLLAIGYEHAGSVLFVALGLAFLVAYLVGTRPYVYLVPAAVLLGFGLGLYGPELLGLSGQFDALVFFALLAAGFLAVFVAVPRRRWPLMPAAILGAVAVILAATGADVIPAAAPSYLVPLILIAVGAYLLVEQRR